MPNRLKYREVRKRLKKYNIVELINRGKGSERIFQDPTTKKFISLTCHGENYELGKGLLKAVIRRFDLPEDIFD
jgi:hypothetical protein